MNKLYSQSMCSVKQWKAYQAAENMVSAEVDEVRSEADEVEPGWSQVIWRQAMQYHQMLKQRHEMEEKARVAQAMQKAEAAKKLTPEEEAKMKAQMAEKMKDDKKFNSGNIRELEEAMEARKNASPVGGISVSKRDRFAKTGSGQT